MINFIFGFIVGQIATILAVLLGYKANEWKNNEKQ